MTGNIHNPSEVSGIFSKFHSVNTCDKRQRQERNAENTVSNLITSLLFWAWKVMYEFK